MCSFQAPLSEPAPVSLDATPARALHTDLLSRWKSLGGTPSTSHGEEFASQVEKTEDEKTVEELLADLGPSEEWDVGKSEEDQVANLLQSAKTALATTPQLENVPGEEGAEDQTAETSDRPANLPAVDVSVFQPEPESEEDEEPAQRPVLGKTKDVLDKEADELLARILDEVKIDGSGQDENESQASESEEEGNNQTQQTKTEVSKADAGAPSSDLNLPTTPSNLPDPVEANPTDTTDDDLASRFAGLSLPVVPTGIKSKSKPATKPKVGFTDEEIDTWCIICSDNATLQCIGCDGDLYCTNCWLEGHRGEDAGYEERTHKAVQFVKGGGKKKAPTRRVMMGA